MLAAISALAGIGLYVLESEKKEQETIDLAASVSPVLEKLVVIGSLPLVLGSMTLHAVQQKYR